MQVLVIALVIIPWPKLTHSIHSTSAPHMTTIGTASLYDSQLNPHYDCCDGHVM